MDGLTADMGVMPGLSVTEGEDLARAVHTLADDSASERTMEGPEFLRVLESVLQPSAEEVAESGENRDAEATTPTDEEDRGTAGLVEPGKGSVRPDRSGAEPVPESVVEASPPPFTGNVPEEPPTRLGETSPTLGETLPTPVDESVHSAEVEKLNTPVGETRPPVVFDFEETSTALPPLEAAVTTATAMVPESPPLPLVGTTPANLEMDTIVELKGSSGESVLIGSEPARDVGAAGSSTLRIEPDLGLLEPDLRVRLERIVERMRNEFGHNVKVIEAYRTPQRQQALYAQGRSAPGPIVTWTEQSLHTEGLAVDVMVDGSFAQHEGYRRLADIAQQEGLSTLWPKDPGHIELRPVQTGPLPAPADAAPQMEAVARPAVVERPALLAQLAAAEMPSAPAEIEPPATTANVARVPVPGSGEPPRDALIIPVASQAAEQVALNERPSERSRVRRPRSVLGEGSIVGPTVGANAAAQSAESLAGAAAPASEASPPTVGSLLVRSPVSAAPESYHRIAQIREIQELGYPRRLGQVTLRMMDGLGEEARMRVRLESEGVSAAIGVRDLGQASLLRTRIGTLEQSLRLQGIEPMSVRVGALTSALESMETSKWMGDSGRRSDADSATGQRSGSEEDRSGRKDQPSAGSRHEDTPRGRENNR